MSTVSIIVRRPKHRTASIRALRPILKLSISALGRHIDTQSPLIEAELFLNDFAEVADQLRGTLRALDSLGNNYLVFENEDEITGEMLLNILEGSEQYRL